MGLFDLFRSKPEEDPILGNRGQQPIGLEVSPIEPETVTNTVFAHGVEGVQPDELIKQLQAAGGDPDELAERLRQMFPGAQISVSESTVDASSNPDVTARVLGSLGFGAPAAADPIAQLERLAALRESGALTDAEFAAAKAKLLG